MSWLIATPGLKKNPKSLYTPPPAPLHRMQVDGTFDSLFLQDAAHMRKMYTYMCQQCTALEDPISNVACQFLSGRLQISFGVSGVAFFEDGIIYPYFYMTREQRRFLYSIASAIACDMQPKHRYRFCNGCIVLVDHSGKILDQRLVWRMILDCVASSPKHKECLRLLAKVVVQRVMCRVAHSKDMLAHVCSLTDEIFPLPPDEKPDDKEWEDA